MYGLADVVRVLVKELNGDVSIKANDGRPPAAFVPSFYRSAFVGIL